jgi:hypothetical protein
MTIERANEHIALISFDSEGPLTAHIRADLVEDGVTLSQHGRDIPLRLLAVKDYEALMSVCAHILEDLPNLLERIALEQAERDKAMQARANALNKGQKAGAGI